MKTPRLIASLAAATAITLGAGATSRDEPPAVARDSAEGFWVATTERGVNVKWAILDGGETWGIYEAQGTILGAFHGSTRAEGGALYGTGLAYDIPSQTTGETRFTGSYIAGQAISLTTTFGVTINGRYVPGYEKPARLAELAGHYRGESLGSHSPVIAMRMSVSGNGEFVMNSTEDCAASGSATPRPGGVNVFNLQLRFAGSACALGDGASASGVAHVSATSGELFVLAMNEARTDGWLFLAQRH